VVCTRAIAASRWRPSTSQMAAMRTPGSFMNSVSRPVPMPPTPMRARRIWSLGATGCANAGR